MAARTANLFGRGENIMSLKNYQKFLELRITPVLGLLFVLFLNVLIANAQKSDIINTNSYNAEIKKIDDEYHECTRRNRYSPTIQQCAVIARNAKNQLALERQEMEKRIIAQRHSTGIHQDEYLTNGGNNGINKEKPYYPYPSDSQIPKSAPKQKKKTIQGGANTNQTINTPIQNQPKPSTSPKIVTKFKFSGEIPWKTNGVNDPLPVEGLYLPSEQRKNEILKDDCIPTAFNRNREKAKLPYVVWVKGRQFGLSKYVVTSVGIKYSGSGTTIKEFPINRYFYLNEVRVPAQ